MDDTAKMAPMAELKVQVNTNPEEQFEYLPRHTLGDLQSLDGILHALMYQTLKCMDCRNPLLSSTNQTQHLMNLLLFASINKTIFRLEFRVYSGCLCYRWKLIWRSETTFSCVHKKLKKQAGPMHYFLHHSVIKRKASKINVVFSQLLRVWSLKATN